MYRLINRERILTIALLIALLPIVVAVRWVVITWPTQVFPDVVYVPETQSLLFTFDYRGTYGRIDTRIFLLDLQEESLKELKSPRVNGTWYRCFGVDEQGKVLAFLDYDRLVSVEPITAKCTSVGSESTCFLDQRFLLERVTGYEGRPFLVWRDLSEPKLPLEVAGICEEAVNPLEAVPGSRYFYSHVDPNDDSEWRFEEATLARTKSSLIPDLELLVLFRLTDSGPVEVSRWPVLNNEVYSDENRIGCLSLDGRSIEIHSVSDGSVERRILIPQPVLGPNSRPFSWAMSHTTLSFSDGVGATFIYDLESGRELDLEDAWLNQIQARTDREYFTIRLTGWPDTWEPVLEVRDAATDSLLSEIPYPDDGCFVSSPAEGIYATNDGEILFATRDMRALFVDKHTGKVVRAIRPRRWVATAAVFSLGSLVAWAALWLWNSRRNRACAVVDAIVFACLALLIAWFRITLAGSPYDMDRPAWQLVGAIFGALSIIAAFYFVRTDRSLFQRILPAGLLFFGLLHGTFYFWQNYSAAHELVVKIIVSGVFMLFGAWIAKKWLPLFEDVRCESRTYSQWTLANMALLTTIIAIVVALAARQDFGAWERSLGPKRLLSVSVSSLVFVATAWITGGCMRWRGNLLFRVACITVALLVSAELLVLNEQWRSNAGFGWSWQLLQEEAVPLVLVSLMTFIVCLPFQLNRMTVPARCG